MITSPLWLSIASMSKCVKRRGYCRVGLVGLKVYYQERRDFVIASTGWGGPRRLMLVIESASKIDHDTGQLERLEVAADDCVLAETWPVRCCWPRDDDRSNVWPGPPDHPLEVVILAALWRGPGLDVATIGAVLRGSTDRDEATRGYEVVAADALRVLRHHGVVERDEAGLFSLAKPSCPAERAEVQL